MENTTNKKICVISLTYNRPWYIGRSFDSLYTRANYEFDHYVFDDCSNEETTILLMQLQKKYKFHLFQNLTRLGILKNFHKNVKNIPREYDIYIKFDSDIEVLTDNFFPQLLDVLDMPAKLSGLTPRVEGINGSRNDVMSNCINFYNGHAIRLKFPVAYGCCLLLTKEAFESFPLMTDTEIDYSTEQFAVDTHMYSHALKFGMFAIVEDLSVYHIDNSYGQRRRDAEYFISRDRWSTIDKNESWLLKASKDIYPKQLTRKVYDQLLQSSIDYDTFLSSCQTALEYKADESNTDFEASEIITELKKSEQTKINVYKISAPTNFVGSKHMKKGTIAYFLELPDWTATDTGIVVEKVRMTIADANKVLVT